MQTHWGRGGRACVPAYVPECVHACVFVRRRQCCIYMCDWWHSVLSKNNPVTSTRGQNNLSTNAWIHNRALGLYRYYWIKSESSGIQKGWNSSHTHRHTYKHTRTHTNTHARTHTHTLVFHRSVSNSSQKTSSVKSPENCSCFLILPLHHHWGTLGLGKCKCVSFSG
jgi:hypothetical protein